MLIFKPETEWVAPDSYPDLNHYDEIAIDLETKDPDLTKLGSGSATNRGEVVGIAVAVKGWSGYFPIAHEGGGNLDKSRVLAWFQDILKTNSIKIFHNAMYDVCWIRAMGLKINGRIVDTMIAAGIINENRFRYDLNTLSREYLEDGKNETALREKAKAMGIDPKAEMYKMPAMDVGSYAEKDAELTLGLWERFKVEIEKEDCSNVFDLETDLFPCLVDMRMKGVRVDEAAAHLLKKDLIKKEKELLFSIKKESGLDVEIWAARSIAKVFDKLKLPYEVTEKTKAPSFTKGFLQNHPKDIIKKIAKAREINKSHTTFIDSILRHSYKGRIHAEINQLRSDNGGTVTGRFSYSNPNLQQIPSRNKELGPLIRSLFLPEENCKWGCFDYSQQEPRLVVHYAKKETCYKVEDVVDSYNNDPETDFHKIVADMANITRTQAKTINLGLFYGMGKTKLQAELGIDKEKSDELFKKYHGQVPFIKQLSDIAALRADDAGHIRTLEGRRCRFDLWQPHGFGKFKPLDHVAALKEHGPGIKRAFTYKALNRLIQGSAADMTKRAMLNLYNAGILPHIQIHDELDISIESDKQVKQITKIMEEAVTLEVPNKVDYECGKNWGDIK